MSLCPTHVDAHLNQLVILGSGWGSMYALRDIDTDKFDVVCVSPRNYFLFTPMLPSATVGTVENRSIVVPIRELISYKRRGIITGVLDLL